MPLKVKDPDAAIFYTFDWSDWLGTDTIASSTWIEPTDITEDASSKTTTTTTGKFSGGTVGKIYRIVNRITTTTGAESPDRSLTLAIEER